MSAQTVLTLLESVRATGLLEPEQLGQLGADPPAAVGHVAELAGALVRRGWLTSYQADQLLLGRAEDLVLGPYVLLDPLGEGGMGRVFKARHRLMKRIVALKVIRPERLTSPDMVARFRRE